MTAQVKIITTSMHSSRMCTVRCSGHCREGGVCPNACWDMSLCPGGVCPSTCWDMSVHGRSLPQCMLGYVCPGGVCPSACWDMSVHGRCLPQCMLGYVCPGVLPQCMLEYVCPGVLPQCMLGYTHPLVNRMTETGVKILPCRNYVADGRNERLYVSNI